MHRPGGVLELVLVVGIVEQRHLERRQRRAVGGIRLLVEDALRVEVLVGLREQHVPVVVELVERLDPCALVLDRVDGPARELSVADRGAAGRNAVAVVRPSVRALPVYRGVARIVDADVGVLARESGRHVVDVPAAPRVIDHRPHRHVAGDDRQIQHRRHVGVVVAVRGVP